MYHNLSRCCLLSSIHFQFRLFSDYIDNEYLIPDEANTTYFRILMSNDPFLDTLIFLDFTETDIYNTNIVAGVGVTSSFSRASLTSMTSCTWSTDLAP
ncbi:unnamed protein product [Adineta ricciae]|uniref:Uncharacterized protein n=1 Tax=Adineta ricciae TaxID=249248 RepID=A0A814TSR3_ADIRI